MCTYKGDADNRECDCFLTVLGEAPLCGASEREMIFYDFQLRGTPEAYLNFSHFSSL
jgi:hypothetical protein